MTPWRSCVEASPAVRRLAISSHELAAEESLWTAESLWAALLASQLVSGAAAGERSSWAAAPPIRSGQCLLCWLEQFGRDAGVPLDERRLSRLRRAHDVGAALTCGAARWTSGAPALTDRLIWWADGVPAGMRVAVGASRAPRPWGGNLAWFSQLRRFVACTDGALLAVEASTAAPWLRQLAAWNGRPCLAISGPTSWRRWTRSLVLEAGVQVSPSLPQCAAAALQNGTRTPPNAPPAALSNADRVAWELADLLLLYELRPGGRWARFFQEATTADDTASDTAGAPWPLYARPGAARGPVPALRSLGQPIAILGPSNARSERCRSTRPRSTPSFSTPSFSTPSRSTPSFSTPSAGDGESHGGVSRLRQPAAGKWLTHCTRTFDGPWPLQAAAVWQTQLLLGRAAARRESPLDTLRQIAAEERLIASESALRSATPMVCFTAADISELPRLRTYRRHRRRWDFEPYGVRVRTSALRRLGARPVIYGGEQQWERLAPADRPYFQVAGDSIDWRLEREWRREGDLDLSLLGAEDVEFFVPTLDEAIQLQPRCRFRVAVADMPRPND